MAKLRPNQFLLPSGALITELPILFQTEMVQAILADRKSQTRRDRNLDHVNDGEYLKTITRVEMGYSATGEYGLLIYRNGDQYNHTFIKSPFGKPGDLLWAKETWQTTFEDETWKPIYKADGGYWREEDDGPMPWKPSIHMRKKYSRIWLMIEDIRVERLQDISEADAIAEGIEEISTKYGYDFDIYKDYMGFMPDGYQAPRYSFKSLIISIYGEKFWNANPYIWVIRYRVLSKTGRPSLQVIEENYLETTSSPQGEAGRGRKEAVHD